MTSQVPHADLIAELQASLDLIGDGDWTPQDTLARRALAALGDTVPREQYLKAGDEAAVSEWAARSAARERDEARAEYLALSAHDTIFVQLAGVYLRSSDSERWPEMADKLRALIDTAPAASLAQHDAEVKAQALEEAADELRNGHQANKPQDVRRGASEWLEHRAAAIREQAK